VDRIEREVQGKAQVFRLPVRTALGHALAQRYHVRGVPMLIVFNGKGGIVFDEAGIPDQPRVVAEVERLVKTRV
jgi:thioredoxin-related protein